MTDKPQITATLADLDNSAKAGSYRQALNGGKIITFPDPGELGWEEAEEFLNDIQNAKSTRKLVERWLSKADMDKLIAAKLTMYQMNELGRRVGEHYKALLGDQGNATGSTES